MTFANRHMGNLFLVIVSMVSPIAIAETTEDKKSVKEVEEVVVLGRRAGDFSVITERAQIIVDVPGSLGDPLLAAFSLPGVIAPPRGGDPAVRGSSPSDNTYMVDGAPAGYVFHSFSTSVFNENIIQDFELYSAGFGPSYSNAIGGVFDIKLRDPKHQDLTTKLDLGVLRAGVFFEGEATENSAFYLSARASLLHLFLNEDMKKKSEEENGIRIETAPQDTDYQFKYLLDLDDATSIRLSANGATDLARAGFTDTSDLVNLNPDFSGDAVIDNHYNNAAISLVSKGSADKEFFVQLGHYVNANDTSWGSNQYFINLQKNDSYLTSHYDFVWNEKHNFSLGTEIHHVKYDYDMRFTHYACTETDADCIYKRGELIDAAQDLSLQDEMLYVNDHWNITSRLAFDIGVQQQHNNFTKETFTSPRLAVSWDFIDRWTLHSSIGQYNRFPDVEKLLPQVGNPDLKSPQAQHYTLGLSHKMDDGWSWSTTTYYKTMSDLPLAMPPTTAPLFTNNVEGEAYGVDIFINKEITQQWYGWLALSASKSLRTNQLTHIENNYYLDTPLVLNWVMNYKFTGPWTAGVRLALQTGRAYTPIIGAQPNPYVANRFAPVYGEAFSENLPTYSRLDLRFKRDMRLFGYEGSFTIDILNALNTKIVNDRNLDYKRTTSVDEFKIEDQVGLGIIPAVGMTIIF